MADTVITGLDAGIGTINIKGKVYNADGAGNFTIPLADAASLFGLGLMRQVVACLWADRPTTPIIGDVIFCTDAADGAGQPIWWNGTIWVDSRASEFGGP